MTVLITGAAGSLGRLLARELPDAVATDVDTMDVTDPAAVQAAMAEHRPALVYHLAGAKHAPEGELDPGYVTRVNAVGTFNVLAAVPQGCRVILASTCKAADPETAYGASKLIAERATLNAGGVVCRFYNVPESGGNVFRLWESLPASEPLPVCKAWRYFIPAEAAIRFLLDARTFQTGRYAIDPGPASYMPELAEKLYPGRPQRIIPLRRGDREREPLKAHAEHLECFPRYPRYLRITGRHDPLGA